MSAVLIDPAVTPEADAIMSAAGTRALAPLFATAESRDVLDLRALTNMKFGQLQSSPGLSVDYCTTLKQLDDAANTAADDKLMPGASTTWAARVLDTMLDACAIYNAGIHPMGTAVNAGSSPPISRRRWQMRRALPLWSN